MQGNKEKRAFKEKKEEREVKSSGICFLTQKIAYSCSEGEA